MKPRRRRPVAERFWEKVDKSGDCWLWIAGTTSNGYGKFWDGSRIRGAHQIAWQLATGTDPGEMYVCHTCDNPPCVRFSHLFLSNHPGNMQDMLAKGRAGWIVHPELVPRGDRHGSRTNPDRLARGERHGMHTHPESIVRGGRSNLAKLTDADVLEIRRRYAEGA